MNTIDWKLPENELPVFPEGSYNSINCLITVNASKLTTLGASYERTVVRSKVVERFTWNGRICPWDVIAWAYMPEPYKEKEV